MSSPVVGVGVAVPPIAFATSSVGVIGRAAESLNSPSWRTVWKRRSNSVSENPVQPGTSAVAFALPDRLYDDQDELAQWARAAHRVAEASPTAKKKARKAMKPARPARKR